MLHTALTAAWSRKRRLVGTALSVVIGVAFLTATLIAGSTVRGGFETAFTNANAGTDALIRSGDRIGGAEDAIPTPFDSALLGDVAALDGVDAVAPSVEGRAQILGEDGKRLGGDGPPTLGAAWIDDPALTGYDLADGRAPAGPGEVVIDRESAEGGKLAVGDETTILTPEPVSVTVVGIATFGDEDSLGGTTLAAFTLAEAQRLFLDGADQLTGLVVAAVDGVEQTELVQRVEAMLPGGLEAITGADLTAEQQADIESDFLGFLTTALLVFAAVALLVAAFSIYNTFSILGAQRIHESALLRTLGASRGQVLAAGVAEAAVVGLIGSVLGIGAGVLVAQGLLALLNGFGLPTGGLQLTMGTVVTAAAVGMVVTMVGGLAPAWRAGRVAPLAALREVAVDTTSASRWRLLVGAIVGAAGVALVLSATGGDDPILRAGAGALAVIVAMVVLGPVVARPVGTLLGAPLAIRGVPGDLARRNAVRNPRRTSSTAAALLVGVGVVSLFTVFGASLSASLDEAVEGAVVGDLVISADSWGGAGLSSELIADVQALPEVDVVAGVGFGPARVDGSDREVGFADLSDIASVVDLDVVEGDLEAVGAGSIAVSADYAERKEWSLGDQIPVTFTDGASEDLELAALYDFRAMSGDVLLSTEVWTAHVTRPAFVEAWVVLADGLEIETGRAAIEAVTDRHGQPSVLDKDGFVEAEVAEIDSLLTLVYGLLAVAVLIALMGIANTLSLSMHERTRELGLLRAVGQSRSQLRAMVRWESVIVATFGSVGGIGVGVFLGWGLIRAMRASEGLGTFALPVGQLAVVVLIGALAGVLAGIRPARRASRLDVLDAISTA